MGGGRERRVTVGAVVRAVAAVGSLVVLGACDHVFPYGEPTVDSWARRQRDSGGARDETPREVGPVIRDVSALSDRDVAARSDRAVAGCQPTPVQLPAGYPRCAASGPNGILVWPTRCDVCGGTCTDAKGKIYPATGPGAANWIGPWLDKPQCGDSKRYPVFAGCSVIVEVGQECCNGCTLRDASYLLQARSATGTLLLEKQVNSPAANTCGSWTKTFAVPPHATSVTIAALSLWWGFYLCVYER